MYRYRYIPDLGTWYIALGQVNTYMYHLYDLSDEKMFVPYIQYLSILDQPLEIPRYDLRTTIFFRRVGNCSKLTTR